MAIFFRYDRYSNSKLGVEDCHVLELPVEEITIFASRYRGKCNSPDTTRPMGVYVIDEYIAACRLCLVFAVFLAISACADEDKGVF